MDLVGESLSIAVYNFLNLRTISEGSPGIRRTANDASVERGKRLGGVSMLRTVRC